MQRGRYGGEIHRIKDAHLGGEILVEKNVIIKIYKRKDGS
jgi:hypothetical protein